MKETTITGEGNRALKISCLKVVNTQSVLKALEKGEIDIAEVPADQYLNAKELTNVELTCKS